MILDIDAKDLEQGRQSLLKLLYGLQPESCAAYTQSYFSGSKGFHLYVSAFLFTAAAHTDTEEYFGPRIQKELAHRLNIKFLSDCDAKIDTIAIGTNRIIRSVNSVNFKSGLFKIPLSREDVELSVSEIQKLARQPKFKADSNLDNRNMYSFKIDADKSPREKLSTLYADALYACAASVEEEGVKKVIVRTGRSTLSRGRRKKPKLFYLTDVVVEKCRAFRQLRRGCIEQGKVSDKEKFLLATILTETKSRRSYLHSFLSLFDGYSKQITDKKLDEKTFTCNCELMATEHHCLTPCSRYILDNMTRSRLPAYFGVSNRTTWVEASTPDNVTQTAFKLRRYHETTTDLFDWNNCLQFTNHHEIYSHIVSDNLRRGKLPLLNNFLINVPKGDGKTRQLALCPFEVELMTAITVPFILNENNKRKLKHRVERNVFSFGFQHLPVSPTDIVLPWLEEYTRFKDVLINCASQKERYPFTLTDDLVNFYPSISNERLTDIINSYRFDLRAKSLLLEFINGSNYVSIETGEAAEFQGLSQGPLITHILASTLLIEIDVAFAMAFSEDEAIMVRYVDDIHVFCRDENVLKRVKAELIPALQGKLGIEFHSAVGQDPGKSFEGSTTDYLHKRLKQDLQKYELKFKAELARMGKEEMEEFFRLLDYLFGATYRSILSADPTINLKDLERQLASLTWKARGILKESEQATEAVICLKRTLLKILCLSGISWKFQTNVVMLYLALTSAFEAEAFGYEISDPKLLSTNYGLFVNLAFQVIKQLCASGHSEMKDLAGRLSMISQIKHTEAIRSLLSDSVLFFSKNQSIETGVASWNYHSEHPKDWSVGFYLSKYFSTFRDGGFDEVDSLLQQSESEFTFYKNVLIEHFSETQQNWDKRILLQIYRIAVHYDINALASHILNEPGILESTGELGQVYEAYGLWVKNYFESAVRRILGLRDDAEVGVLKSEKSHRIVNVGKDVCCVESIRIKNQLEKTQFERVLPYLRSFADVKYEFEADDTLIIIVTNLGVIDSSRWTQYLSDASRAKEILSAESRFISDAGENQSHLRRLIIPASCLAISNGHLKIQCVVPILTSTINFVYTYQNHEKAHVEEGRMHMPGLRIDEFCRSQRRHNRDIVEDPVFKIMVSFVNARFRYADMNKSFPRIIAVLDSLLSYLDRWSEMAIDGVKYSEIYEQCYRLVKSITRNQPSARFRPKDNPQCTFYNMLLSQFRTLMRVPVTPQGQERSVIFLDLMMQQDNLRQLWKLRKIATYNVYFAANLLLAFQKSRKQCSCKDYVEPVLVVLGLGVYYYFCAALEEVPRFFTFAAKRRDELEEIVNQFYCPANMKLLRENFVYPTLTNVDNLKALLTTFDAVDIRCLNKVKPKHSFLCLGVDKFTFVPDPLDPDTIAEAFTDIRFFVKVRARWLSDALTTFLKSIAKKVGHVDNLRGSHELYEAGSVLQDWSHQNLQYIERHAYLTSGNSGYHLSYEYKLNQTLSPEAFASSKLFLPLYKRKLIIGLIIAVILSFSTYLLQTEARNILLHFSKVVGFIISKPAEEMNSAPPPVTKDAASSAIGNHPRSDKEPPPPQMEEASRNEKPVDDGKSVRVNRTAESSREVEKIETTNGKSASREERQRRQADTAEIQSTDHSEPPMKNRPQSTIILFLREVTGN